MVVVDKSHLLILCRDWQCSALTTEAAYSIVITGYHYKRLLPASPHGYVHHFYLAAARLTSPLAHLKKLSGMAPLGGLRDERDGGDSTGAVVASRATGRALGLGEEPMSAGTIMATIL